LKGLEMLDTAQADTNIGMTSTNAVRPTTGHQGACKRLNLPRPQLDIPAVLPDMPFGAKPRRILTIGVLAVVPLAAKLAVAGGHDKADLDRF
jgi:hypothetical protein